MQMRSRGAELNPWSERRLWLQVPTACWSQSMWGIYFSTNCWHRCTDDKLICMMGPYSFHPAAWWTGGYILKQAFCWARSKMNLHSSFFKNKKKGGEGIFFLFRLCDDSEDNWDMVSVIHQRQQEYQLKSSMFMNKSPQESPGEQTLQKCIAENRACVFASRAWGFYLNQMRQSIMCTDVQGPEGNN